MCVCVCVCVRVRVRVRVCVCVWSELWQSALIQIFLKSSMTFVCAKQPSVTLFVCCNFFSFVFLTTATTSATSTTATTATASSTTMAIIIIVSFLFGINTDRNKNQ